MMEESVSKLDRVDPFSFAIPISKQQSVDDGQKSNENSFLFKAETKIQNLLQNIMLENLNEKVQENVNKFLQIIEINSNKYLVLQANTKTLQDEHEIKMGNQDTKNLIFIKLINPAPEISWIIYNADQILDVQEKVLSIKQDAFNAIRYFTTEDTFLIENCFKKIEVACYAFFQILGKEQTQKECCLFLEEIQNDPVVLKTKLQEIEFEKVSQETVKALKKVVQDNPEVTKESLTSISPLLEMFWTIVLQIVNYQKPKAEADQIPDNLIATADQVPAMKEYLTRTHDEITFISGSTIKKMKWGEKVKENNRQSCLKSFKLFPNFEAKKTLEKLKELENTFEIELRDETLSQFRLHKANKRVSIIYPEKGLYTFKLNETCADLYKQETRWRGNLGTFEDFEFYGFKIDKSNNISARGYDDQFNISHRQYEIQGEINKDVVLWSGQSFKDNEDNREEKTQNNIITLVQKKDGRIVIEENDTDLGDQEDTYTITLENFQQDNVKFTQKFKKTGQKFVYVGKIYEENNQLFIEGEYNKVIEKKQAKDQGKFKLQKCDLITFKISPSDDRTEFKFPSGVTHLDCKGKLFKETGKMTGLFTYNNQSDAIYNEERFQPCAIKVKDGDIHYFITGDDKQVYHQIKVNKEEDRVWVSLEQNCRSGITACSWGPNRIDIFVIGTQNILWQRTWDGSNWNEWVSLEGLAEFTSTPAACSWGPDRIDIFARGQSHQLWHKWWDGDWRGWENLGGKLASAPSAVCQGPDRIDIFARGTDNKLHHLKRIDQRWLDWVIYDGELSSSPSACWYNQNRLDVFSRGADLVLQNKMWDGKWHDWEKLDGKLDSAPSCFSISRQNENEIQILAYNDKKLEIKSYIKNLWQPWSNIKSKEIIKGDHDGLLSDKNKKFEFLGFEIQDHAQQIYLNEDYRDAQFVSVKDSEGKVKDNIFATANLRFQYNVAKVNGHSSVELDLIDLDQDIDENNLEGKIRFCLVCNVPENFKETINSSGQTGFPFYIFSDFKVEEDENEKFTFYTEFFYQDTLQNNRKLIFLKGRGGKMEEGVNGNQNFQAKIDQIQSTEFFTQQLTVMKQNTIVQYPILAYKTDLPSDDELVICNLARNYPQKKITISPFRFIHFIETGLVPERLLDTMCKGEAINTSVFFVVEFDQEFFLMNYRCQPWVIENDFLPENMSKEKFQFQEQILLFKGQIEQSQLKEYKNRLTQDKIQSASFLQQKSQRGVYSILVFQLVDEIVCFDLLKSQQLDQKNVKNIMMQRGPSEQIYYISQDSNDDQLCQLTYSSKSLQWKDIYRSQVALILAFHVQYNDQEQPEFNEYPHHIYFLDSEKYLKRLSVTYNQNYQQVVQDLNIKLDGVSCISEVIRSLQTIQWSTVLLNENGIVALFKNEDQSQNATDAKYLSTKSQLADKFEFLGFQDDKKFRTKNFKENKTSKPYPQSVLSLNFVPWIGKSLFEIKEGKKSYFMIASHYGNKRIDMMRIDTELTFKFDQKILANRFVAIKFQYTDYYLLYCQKRQTYQGYLQTSLINQLTNTSKSVQYFQIYKESQHYWVEGNVPQTLIRIENGNLEPFKNNYEVICDKIYDQFDQWLKEYILGIEFYEWPYNESGDIVCYDELPGKICENPYWTKYDEKANDFNDTFIPDREQWSFCDDSQILGLFVYQYKKTTKVENEMEKFYGSTIPIKVTTFNRNQDMQVEKTQTIKIEPTYFVLQCDYWKKDQPHQHLFTKDFLVIKHGNYLCFAKLQDIVKPNNAQKIVDENKKSINFKQLLDSCKHIQFNLIYLKKLSHIMRNDCKIVKVTNFNTENVADSESHSNLIQISFQDFALIWCLDENKEVAFQEKPTDFASQEDYISTGYVPHMLQNKQSTMKDSHFFTFNESNSLVLMPKTDQKHSKLIRTFAFINLLDILEIQSTDDKNLYLKKIDENTLVQSFNGLTFFEQFKTNPDYIELLVDKIQSGNALENKQIDEFGEEFDNILIRKIYWTLNMPLIKTIDLKSEEIIPTGSILQYVFFDPKIQQMIDPLLKLTMLSQEFRSSDILANFKCFKKVFAVESSEVQNFLMNSFFENSLTREVTYMQWDPNHSLITFGSDISLLSSHEIVDKVSEEQMHKRSWIEYFKDPKGQDLKKKKMYRVNVRILEIEWLCNNLQEFYMFLNILEDNKIFGNEFIKVLLEQQYYSDQLIRKVFVFYIVYQICSLVYLSYYIPQVEIIEGGFFGSPEDRIQGALRSVIILGSLGFSVLEIVQICYHGCNYFKDVWNYFFWVVMFLTMGIVICHGCRFDVELNTLVQISSGTIILHWLVLLYWLRLFPQLAYYVTMIQETIIDISYFFVMFIMCIAMFANAIYVLNLMSPAQLNELPNESLYDEAFKEPFIDSIFTQYLVGLGQFSIDNYSDHPANILIYIYFIGATLFTQIMFLNMLIAIMSETFERVSEAKERSALMERTHLYADFIWAIKFNKTIQGKRYLYVVRPVNTEKDESLAIRQVQTKLSDLISEKNQQHTDDFEILQQKVRSIIKQNQKAREKVNQKLEQITNTQSRDSDELTKLANQQEQINKKLDSITEMLAQLKK